MIVAAADRPAQLIDRFDYPASEPASTDGSPVRDRVAVQLRMALQVAGRQNSVATGVIARNLEQCESFEATQRGASRGGPMRNWLRRLRGAFGTAATWALAWSPFGALWGIADWLLFLDATPLAYLVATSAALFGGAGLAGGAIFSVILNRVEGSQRLDQLSLPRFTGWGAAGGALLAALLVLSNGLGQLSLADMMALAALPLLGAGSAAGSLVLARSTDDRELLEAGEDVAEVGITEEEATQLLGSS